MPRLYEFGPFRLDVEERVLWNANQTVQLTPKVFDTLLLLIKRRGRLVSKDEFIQALWPDSFVEERSLTQNIFLLRKVLGDGESGRRYIQTVPKRGYRFIAEVRTLRHALGAEGCDAAVDPAAVETGDGPAAQQADRVLPPVEPGTRSRMMRRHLALLAGLLLIVFCSVAVVLLSHLHDSRRAPVAPAARGEDGSTGPGAENKETNYYLQTGLHLWNQRTPDGIKKSVGYFQKAIEQEPGNALAYASLADSYFLIHFYDLDGFADGEAYRKSVEAATAALERDPSLAEAHRAMAMILPWDRPNSPTVERYFRKSIELNSSLATTHQRYGQFLVHHARLDEGIVELRRAHDLDPTSPATNRALVHTLLLSRRYDELIRLGRVWLDVDPNDTLVRSELTMAYIQKGMRVEAAAEVRRLEGAENGRMDAYGLTAYMNAVAGNDSEALRFARRFKKESQRWPAYSMYYLAVIFAAMGREEEALRHLDRVGDLIAAGPAAQMDFFLHGLLFAPEFDRLRNDNRFAEILRRYSRP